jgi:SAM-dependent methyltransferase
MSEKHRVFEEHAADYDRWFDDNPEVFRLQVRAVRRAVPEGERILEVGVGSGRFAAALGIGHGIDPSLPLARMARMRGIGVVRGCGENLPYRDGSFDAIVMMTVICYLDNISLAFREAFRVLVPAGRIVIGFLERDGEVCRTYRTEPEKGRFLRHARFFSPDEVARELTGAGFSPPGIFSRDRGFCVMAAGRPGEGKP